MIMHAVSTEKNRFVLLCFLRLSADGDGMESRSRTPELACLALLLRRDRCQPRRASLTTVRWMP